MFNLTEKEREEKIYKSLDAAINKDPATQKAFEDMEGVKSPEEREAKIKAMASDMAHQTSVKGAIKTKLFEHNDEKSYENMYAKFDDGMKNTVQNEALRHAIAEQAANEYLGKVKGKDHNPHHEEAMQVAREQGIRLEVGKAVDNAFDGGGIASALHKALPPGIADVAANAANEGIDQEKLKTALGTAVTQVYNDEHYQNASPAQKHEMVANAVTQELEKSGAVSVRQMAAVQEGEQLLNVTNSVPLLSSLELGKHADIFEKIAADTVTRVIASEVADKVVPGEARSPGQNIFSAVSVGVGDAVHGLTSLVANAGRGKQQDVPGLS